MLPPPHILHAPSGCLMTKHWPSQAASVKEGAVPLVLLEPPQEPPVSGRSGPFSNCSAFSPGLQNRLPSIDTAAPAWEDGEHVSCNTWVYFIDDSERCAGGILESVYT